MSVSHQSSFLGHSNRRQNHKPSTSTKPLADCIDPISNPVNIQKQSIKDVLPQPVPPRHCDIVCNIISSVSDVDFLPSVVFGKIQEAFNNFIVLYYPEKVQTNKQTNKQTINYISNPLQFYDSFIGQILTCYNSLSWMEVQFRQIHLLKPPFDNFWSDWS